MKLRPWQLSLIAVSLCALTLAGVLRYRGQAVQGHEWMFRRLPTDHAIMVGIDVEALREAGLLEVLAGPRATEELDYRRFVDQTGFDYRSDLDYVAASIALNNSARHFVLKGRFNWDGLFKTATRAGGRCQNTFCDMPGFTAGKDMSFLPLGPDALGLSSTAAQQAAWALTAEYTGVPMPSVPAYPIFFAMDAAVLSSGGALPAVLRPLADVLSSADYVVFGLLAGKDGNFELALDADCMSETSASGLRDTISGIVGHAGSTFSMLHNGRVQSQGRSVRGRWTLDRNAVQSLIAP